MKITEEQLELLLKRPDVVTGFVMYHTKDDIIIALNSINKKLYIPIDSFDFKDLDEIELNVSTREITNLAR